MTGLLALILGMAGADAQETLEVEITRSTGMSMVEAEEQDFKNSLETKIPLVATLFADPPATVEASRTLVRELDNIGIGQNSQVVNAICTIERVEIPARRETLNDVNFHLEKVEGLLSEYPSESHRTRQVGAAINESYSRDPNAIYLYMHAGMEVQDCVPAELLATIQEAEQARLEIVQTIRE
jgi:hypothetical protein